MLGEGRLLPSSVYLLRHYVLFYITRGDLSQEGAGDAGRHVGARPPGCRRGGVGGPFQTTTMQKLNKNSKLGLSHLPNCPPNKRLA